MRRWYLQFLMVVQGLRSKKFKFQGKALKFEEGGMDYWLLMLVLALDVMSRIADVRAPLVAPLGPGNSSEVSFSRQPDSRMISRSSPAAPVCFDTS
jgi:hypothetical protein